MQMIHSKWKLRVFLLSFSVLLLLPSLFFVQHAYQQLELESFMRHRRMAENIIERVDTSIIDLLNQEENRSANEYNFFITPHQKNSSSLNRLPDDTSLPGLLGYFQIDSKGEVSSPVLPPFSLVHTDLSQWGVDAKEEIERKNLKTNLIDILKKSPLSKNLAQRKTFERVLEDTSPSITSRRSPDSFSDSILSQEKLQLSRESQSLGFKKEVERGGQAKDFNQTVAQVSELNLDKSLDNNTAVQNVGKSYTYFQKSWSNRLSLKNEIPEKSETKSIPAQRESTVAKKKSVPENTFAHLRKENGPFQFKMLEGDKMLFYRNSWVKQQRFIQGFILSRKSFFEQIVKPIYTNSPLVAFSKLILAYEGNILHQFSPSSKLQKKPILLLKDYLSAPLSKMTLLFSMGVIPLSSDQNFIDSAVIFLLFVFILGVFGFYRLGMAQINLAHRQNNFISSISHELKTPLTSIRMYGEMLREGMVGEDKKKSYYDFIFYESERLSRLISNVLRLARIQRHDDKIHAKNFSASALLNILESRLSTQCSAAGFELRLIKSGLSENSPSSTEIKVDEDAFIQIFINLVDNALKFSKESELKIVELGLHVSNKQVSFSVRDYGPGISKSQSKKVFKLFYRSENELTRKTQGTGIGLALVRELCQQVDARIEIRSPDRGAEFVISFENQTGKS